MLWLYVATRRRDTIANDGEATVNSRVFLFQCLHHMAEQ
jgi:hypothetical protein